MDALVTADSHLHTSGRYLDIEGDRLAAYREGRWRAFERVVEAALDGGAELFVHCGDLFDVADPGTGALARAVGLFAELEAAGVTPVVVPGNHDASRVVDGEEVTDADATTPVDLLAAADVGVAFTDCERVAATTVSAGGTEVWVGGLGYDPALDVDADPLYGAELDPGGDVSLLVTHHCVEGHEWGLTDFPVLTRRSVAALGVDAVCSGHVHAAADFRVGDTRVLVPGAPDYRSVAEAAIEPGYYAIEFGEEVTATRHALDARPVLDRRVEAADLPAGTETAALVERVESWATPDALLRVCLADPEGRVDREAVRRAGRAACAFTLHDA
jgi:DNA repair exonuclease SbcCD nuclease subunit